MEHSNPLLRGQDRTHRFITMGEIMLRLTPPNYDKIRVAKRVKGNETLYFMVNECPYDLPPMEIALDGAEGVVQADPATGRFVPVYARKGNRFTWGFRAYGSAIFITGATADAPPDPPYDAAKSAIALQLDNGWTMKPLVRHKAGKTDFEIAPVADARACPADLTDWRRVLGPDFSGKVLYRVEFDCAEAEERWLDLGTVKWCCCMPTPSTRQPLSCRFRIRATIRSRFSGTVSL